jgi:hypothetical protein
MEQEQEAAGAVGERDSNRIIEQQLEQRVGVVEDARKADVLTYMGPLYPLAGDVIKDAVEELHGDRKAVLVILETLGGYMDVAERIAIVLRKHYEGVDFLVPRFAMSAGTVLVMSGDAIWMDYASMLGPIDPQVQKEPGQWVPALGYIEQFNRLMKKADEGELSTAELTYLVENFDPAELYSYEQERELSIALLRQWLVQYKFKNWTETETQGKEVTKRMRSRRAADVARKLNATDRWHSHNRGIPMEVLRRDLKLLIDDFGADPTLGPAVHGYFHLLYDYSMRRGHDGFVLHTRKGYVGY